MSTQPQTFYLFPLLPPELQHLVLAHAASPSTPSPDDLEFFYADQTADPPSTRSTTLVTSFLRAKLEHYLEDKSSVLANGWGGGKMDPMRPWIMLLSCTTIRAQFYHRQTTLLIDRKRLLWTNRLCRLVALEAFQRDIEGLNVHGVRSAFEEDERVVAKGEFGDVLECLVQDVRGLLRGQRSKVGELWGRQMECLRRREAEQDAEIEYETG